MTLNFSLSRSLFGVRIGVWLFSYTLFFAILAAGGATRADTLLYIGMLAAVGLALSGATEFVVKRTRQSPVFRRLLLVAFAVLLVTVLNAAIDVATLGRSISPAATHDLRFHLINGLQSFAFLVWIHAFCAACVWLVGATQDLVEKERQLAEAESAAQRATLSALRSQVNPHFLFNTLNAAASLIATERNKQAEELIIGLSEFFRSSLAGDRPAMVSLGEEFDMLDAYLQIELVRFPGRLDVSMECPSQLADAPLPSFLLLPLVENAIKHAVAHSQTPVVVSIVAASGKDRLVLSVENRGAERGVVASSQGEGMGLRNVAQRLNAIYGSAATLEAAQTINGFKVRIEIPVASGD